MFEKWYTDASFTEIAPMSSSKDVYEYMKSVALVSLLYSKAYRKHEPASMNPTMAPTMSPTMSPVEYKFCRKCDEYDECNGRNSASNAEYVSNGVFW